MRLAAIDTDALFELVWAAPLATIGVALTFSLCVHGAARSSDARRAGNAGLATAYGALTVLAGLAFGVTVIVGVLVMTNKD